MIIVALSFPLVGVFTSYFDPQMNDPMILRVVLGILVSLVCIGTYIHPVFVEKFYIFFNTLLFLILVWTCYITLLNDFSFSTAFFYIAAITIISFTLQRHQLVGVFFVVTMIISFGAFYFSQKPTINLFSLFVAIVFIQLVAFLVVRQKSVSEQLLKKTTNDLQTLVDDKERFIQLLAHDLKNPFHAISGFSGLLLKNLNKYESDKIESYVKIINQTSVRTYDLLENMLLWSKAQSGKMVFNPQKVSFGELCNEVITNLAPTALSKQIDLQFIDPENITLMADLNMLKAVFRNLISNALKYTPESGRVKISAKRIENLHIIEVSDTGVGMTKDEMNRLWKDELPVSKNGTKGEKGTGFGLLLCKEFIEKHQGEITAESKKGEGTVFVIKLPVKD
jgi:signal transduction histidine kinase